MIRTVISVGSAYFDIFDISWLLSSRLCLLSNYVFFKISTKTELEIAVCCIQIASSVMLFLRCVMKVSETSHNSNKEVLVRTGNRKKLLLERNRRSVATL